MERIPNDNNILDLLGKLKKLDVSYPPNILAARRQQYLQQITNIGLGIGVSAGIKKAAKGGNGITAGTILTSKFLEIILVAAIAIEAGTAAYIYRNKIADIVKTYTNPPSIHETIHPSRNLSSSNSKLVEATETPFTTATATVTASSTNTPPTPSNTPSSGVAASNNNNNNGANVNASPTPNPNGNNGNHYGQTPKPERTKDNNKAGNGNNGNANNNNHGSNNNHNNGGNDHHGGDNNHNNGGNGNDNGGNHHRGGNKP